ncbi:TetR/AcrR family transcriptional regulator [Micromonospora mirobrigensis]|uniref:Transcriptional regulator, TetR family n=1 Tax=Micromonospora mirobrigensis TaxID=262898 RepID=A0A1C4ZCK6_9ACTN|nr:TetR/AcrR family transcriptional regulator [Micromonospora mirobrigensis]SCF30687.1 transcriptional regulator, TetR family [Micromonospora mirobrigensis]
MDATKDDTGPALPPAIEAAWGLRGRPPKGPRPGLTLAGIVEAAVRVADDEGLAAVSMGRVAKELGAGTMALYRYVGAKDELLTLMVDTAYGGPPGAGDEGRGWRAGLTRWAWADRSALRRHPWVLLVPIAGPPLTPNSLAWLEDGLRCLADTGLAENEKMSVLLLVTGYVRNESLLTAQIVEGSRAAGIAPGELMPTYRCLVARLTDPQRFPALHRVLAAGVLDRDDDPDDEFVFGLERVLDGVAALIDRRSTD